MSETDKRKTGSSSGGRSGSNNSRRRRRRRRSGGCLGVLIIILLLLCAGLIVIRTPLFDIEKIKVEGNVNVTEEEILTVSGIDYGLNMFEHNNAYYEEKILSLPYISDAVVKKRFPSELKITVSEEYEFAAIELGERLIACDKNGKSIRVILPEEAEDIIVVKGCKEGKFLIGGYIVLDSEEETNLMKQCLTCISDYGFRDVTAIDISDSDNIVFTVGESLTVKVGALGNEDELSYKMAYIKEVIDSLPDNISGIIDATNPEAGVSYRTGEYEYSAVAEDEFSSAESEKTEEGMAENVEGEEATEEISN